MSMQGRTVMITGAAGSLGRAVAEAFHAAGATLALVDLQLEGLQKAYPGSDPRRRLLAANLTDAESAAQAVQQAGRVDALCNIAGGFSMGTPVHSTPAAEWQKMWDTNALTLLNMVQAVVPGMIAQGRGSIVNVGAGAGQKGVALMGAYSVSKSAVIRMTEAMSAELREQGVNVNCVLPSIIDTPPNRAAMPDADPSKWVAPQDLASVILFLCSDGARAVHGAALPVVGLS